MIEIRYLPREVDRLGLTGIYAPMFICDVCREHILKSGNFCFDMQKISTVPVLAHKGTCTNETERAIEAAGGQFGCDEIEALPTMLHLNLRHPPGKVLSRK